MKYRIVNGNIIDARVEAIVLPANSMLKEGSGASEAIFKAAGRKALTKKCKEIGFCEVGSVVPTLGYDLDSKYIIHAVVPKWEDGNHDEYNLLSSAYVASLQVADIMNCKSIAFPLLASGNNGFDLDLAFEIAIKNIETFEPTSLEEAVIVVHGNHVAEMVKELGYEVEILPRNLERDEEELRKKEKNKKILEDAKGAAAKFADEQIQRGLEFIKNPKNQKRAFELGLVAVKWVFDNRDIFKKKK